MRHGSRFRVILSPMNQHRFRPRHPKSPPDSEWLTKEEAGEFLGSLGIRRVEVLLKLHHWTTRKEKREGWRKPATVIALEDLKTYKASLNAPIIDVGERGKAVAQWEKPGRGSGGPALVEAFMALGDKLGDKLAEVLGRLAPQGQLPEHDASRFFTLKAAAVRCGLSRRCLENACASGELPYVEDGPPSKRRTMVRLSDVEKLGHTEKVSRAGV